MQEYTAPDISQDADRLFQIARRYSSANETGKIQVAFDYASKMHASQQRADGKPYIVHPTRVACYTLQYYENAESDLAVVALLHDALEDTSATYEQVVRLFGTKIAEKVLLLTRQRNENETKQQRAIGKVAKLQNLEGAPKDVRMVKCFDLLDNALSWKYIASDLPYYKKIPRWISEAQRLYIPFCKNVFPPAATLITAEMESLIFSGIPPGPLEAF